ncbi:Hsp33 family molecular chaperone HslO [Bdellovibrio sp. SKB1291214]|uniref:Hsp33 family molecular chaperone HslO n=1 Tax=Bdellovibrio sp. SKB1291214 TaxID=1732569 RepID=UPI00223F5146|nr:Hsp33 family molecular chaperone HslO [Bdellovibrio sp. SKB1291214]UYL09568.1 Hsp33 family molecular chaperone HslO [Bdellovibrio sp. SKB1291214]
MGKERVHRFVSKDLTVRIAAVNATEVVQHMQDLQNTFPLATVGVGRGMVGALLLASHLKDGQQVGLLFRGNGPLSSIYAEASYEGHVRGYTPNPQYQPENYDDGLSLRKALGIGLLTVARHQPFQKQPFQGTVEMVSSEIGDDIAHYLHQSHQIRSLVSLGVYLDKNGKVQSAGGVLIEVMPGVEESMVEKIIANYESPCTKARVMRALEAMGEDELQDMINKKEEVHVTCQVCGKPYSVSVDEVQELKNHIHRESMN